MKKILVLAALVGASVAHADGYLALDYAKSKINLACEAGAGCTQQRTGWGVRWGGALPAAYSLKVDDFSVDTVEAGWLRSGRLTVSDIRGEATVTTGSGTPPSIIDVKTEFSAQALYAAVIGRYALAPDLSAYGRLGLAYVSTTSAYTRKNLSAGSVTENHWSPLLGLGLEYAVMPGFKLNAGIQAFKAKTKTVGDVSVTQAGASPQAVAVPPQSVSATVREITLGGQYDF